MSSEVKAPSEKRSLAVLPCLKVCASGCAIAGLFAAIAFAISNGIDAFAQGGAALATTAFIMTCIVPGFFIAFYMFSFFFIPNFLGILIIGNLLLRQKLHVITSSEKFRYFSGAMYGSLILAIGLFLVWIFWAKEDLQFIFVGNFFYWLLPATMLFGVFNLEITVQMINDLPYLNVTKNEHAK